MNQPEYILLHSEIIDALLKVDDNLEKALGDLVIDEQLARSYQSTYELVRLVQRLYMITLAGRKELLAVINQLTV